MWGFLDVQTGDLTATISSGAPARPCSRPDQSQFPQSSMPPRFLHNGDSCRRNQQPGWWHRTLKLGTSTLSKRQKRTSLSRFLIEEPHQRLGRQGRRLRGRARLSPTSDDIQYKWLKDRRITTRPSGLSASGCAVSSWPAISPRPSLDLRQNFLFEVEYSDYYNLREALDGDTGIEVDAFQWNFNTGEWINYGVRACHRAAL